MTHNFPLTLLYDGQCPVCALEMDNFCQRDQRQMASGQPQRLIFVDISVPGFDATPYGATLPDMQALIHAVRPDGSLVVGVPALRLAYRAVGLGAWAAPTGWPLLAPVFDWAYSRFARNRYRFSGVLMPLIAHVAARRAVKRARACADGTCAVPGGSTEFISKTAFAPCKTCSSSYQKRSSQPVVVTRMICAKPIRTHFSVIPARAGILVRGLWSRAPLQRSDVDSRLRA